MKRGFTLIELLVTVSLLSLLVSFSVPTYHLIVAQLQLSQAAAQTGDFFRLTEQKTVTEQQIYGVTLTAGAASIPQFLYNTSNGTKTTQTTLSLPSAIIIDTVSFSGNNDVRFTTSGAPNVSGYLVLRDTIRNKYRRVDIRPSGAVLDNQSEY